jgi:hypothetical protein
MGLGVPREVQQLDCVCANEFRDAADCGEYRKAGYYFLDCVLS